MGFVSRLDEFHEMAMTAVGLEDFGPKDYHEPLQRLLSDYDRFPRFSEAGINVTVTEIVGKLAGRLFAEAGFKAHPQHADTPIERPIVIVGMPRTGTTALQRLLSQDPDTQGLEPWLGAMPMPRPPRPAWERHPLYQAFAQQIDRLYAMSPSFRDMHPVHADQPDECRFALDQSFWSPGAASMATIPEYASWCLAVDARFVYRRYRNILGLIADGDRRRWVLKNPDHIFALDTLLDVFPDACIVQTHREPATSLASVASMSFEVLRARDPQRTRLEHGGDMHIWVKALEKAERVRRAADPARFFDLHIDEIQADQVGAVERIYAHFGLPVSAAARAAWHARAKADPRAGHGAHRYSPESYGFSTRSVREAAPLYGERYERVLQHMRRRAA